MGKGLLNSGRFNFLGDMLRSIPSKYSHKYQTKKFFQNILLRKGHDLAFKKESK